MIMWPGRATRWCAYERAAAGSRGLVSRDVQSQTASGRREIALAALEQQQRDQMYREAHAGQERKLAGTRCGSAPAGATVQNTRKRRPRRRRCAARVQTQGPCSLVHEDDGGQVPGVLARPHRRRRQLAHGLHAARVGGGGRLATRPRRVQLPQYLRRQCVVVLPLDQVAQRLLVLGTNLGLVAGVGGWGWGQGGSSAISGPVTFCPTACWPAGPTGHKLHPGIRQQCVAPAQPGRPPAAGLPPCAALTAAQSRAASAARPRAAGAPRS